MLVCEMDDKGSLAQYLGEDSLGFAPVEVAENLFAMAMNTEDSLREYIRLFLRVPIIGSLTPLAKIFDFVANAAPAVKEILSVGKLCYEVRELNYDLVVVDSEASGHFVAQVSAPDALATLVRIGIVADQTKWMSDLLHDKEIATVLAVVTPEEMPVIETIELRERLVAATPIDFAGVLVNRMPRTLDDDLLSVADSPEVSQETRSVVAWLGARRRAAEYQAKRLADAFELGNVETISDAGGSLGDPKLVTAHLVAEIERILKEHA